jgi:hypothetical protein
MIKPHHVAMFTNIIRIQFFIVSSQRVFLFG